MRLFARRSEYEPESKQLEPAQGIWLDGFHGERFNANDWANYSTLGKSVLIDAKEWHYEAPNCALALFGYTIDHDAHVARFDGLPTKTKLEMLS